MIISMKKAAYKKAAKIKSDRLQIVRCTFVDLERSFLQADSKDIL
jgi:hypothetical protein